MPRQGLATEAANRLQEARCLLVHSRLGNGKTIFMYILAHALSRQGYRCFWLHNDAPFLQRDVEILKTFNKSAIFFDSYDAAIVFIEQLSEMPSDTKFVVAIRTSVQEVRLHEILSRLPSRLERIDLNGIQRDDIQAFRELFDATGLGGKDAESTLRKSRDFRDVVLGLYENTIIKKKIDREFSPLLEDREFRSVFVVSHLLKWIGHDVDVAFARSVTHSDAYAAIAKHQEISGDIFSLTDDSIGVRSAVFSEYLIQNHLSTWDIMECVYSIIVEAVKRKRSRGYQAILSSLMRVSLLRRALRGDADRVAAMKALFERLRRDVDVNREPLFWLQYSILMTEDEELGTAERFIRTAYERASENPGFHTFQIDTYALKLFLLIEEKERDGDRVKRFDEIVNKVERVREIFGEESRRLHAIQVLKGIEPFVAARLAALSNGEKMALVQHLHLLVQDLDGLGLEGADREEWRQARVGVSASLTRIVEFDSR